MLMKLYNSLSKKPAIFAPEDGRDVIMYVCGITPYDSAHIGHARTYVSMDVLKRHLKRKGHRVYHIQNITDVDDKIIKRCMETGSDPKRLTTDNHDEALDLLGKLAVLPADVYPKVTDHIQDIISLVSLLIQKGAAYETPTGVYFSISSFKDYGALSGQDLEQIRAGARVDVDETKKDPADFALWKKTQGALIEFDSPWGRGRPGWHIECSAMARRYAKGTLDIHGGGRDLIFPHHENEIAQSEATGEGKFCHFWVHPGFLTVHGEKMSKSLGNFVTLREALTRFTPNSMRLFYLQAHYRSPLDYDEDKIEGMDESVERIFNSLGLLREECNARHPAHEDPAFRKESDSLIAQFERNMDDDLNTPEAIAAMFNLLRLTNAHISQPKPDRDQLVLVKDALEAMLSVLGLEEERADLDSKTAGIISLAQELGLGTSGDAAATLDMLIDAREKARGAKDYARSDIIRDKLKGIGIILEDKKGKEGGPRWKITA
jgi:cysteinyl-tRNA synthetase